MEAATEGVRSATMRTLRVAFLSALAMDMLAGFGVGLVAMVLGLRLLWGELDLQTAMAVLLVAPEIFIPLRRAGAEFHASAEGQAAAARVLEVLATPLPRPTPAQRRPPRRSPRPDAGATPRVEGLRVDLRASRWPALDGFSLTLAPGEPDRADRRVRRRQVDRPRRAAALLAPGGRLPARSTACPRPRVTAAAWRASLLLAAPATAPLHRHVADNLRLGAPDAPDDDLLAVLAPSASPSSMANLPEGLATQARPRRPHPQRG